MANEIAVVRQNQGYSEVDKFVSKLGEILYSRAMRRPEPAAVIEPTKNNKLSLLNLNDQLDFLDSNSLSLDDGEERSAIVYLAQSIETCLRDAKSRHLECCEVLVPCDLTTSIALEVVRLSEDEPCGLRGCLLYLDFEERPGTVRRIGKIKYDPHAVATFEMAVTLKQDSSSWLGLRILSLKIKGCWKKPFGKAATVVVSPGYTLTKNKLYREGSELMQ